MVGFSGALFANKNIGKIFHQEKTKIWITSRFQ